MEIDSERYMLLFRGYVRFLSDERVFRQILFGALYGRVLHYRLRMALHRLWHRQVSTTETEPLPTLDDALGDNCRTHYVCNRAVGLRFVHRFFDVADRVADMYSVFTKCRCGRVGAHRVLCRLYRRRAWRVRRTTTNGCRATAVPYRRRHCCRTPARH